MSELRRLMQIVEKSSDLVFEIDHLDYRYGQHDFRLKAIRAGEVVGTISFSEYQGEVKIGMIDSLVKREGIATAMLKHLQRRYPDLEIDWGSTTEDGAALYGATAFRDVPNEDVVELHRQLDAARAQEARFQAIGDRFSADPSGDAVARAEFEAIRDQWSDLQNEISQLEVQIDDRPRSRRLIQTESVTSNLRSWFGSSKVVDRNGQPLIVYHGSPDSTPIWREGFKACPEKVCWTDGANHTAFFFAGNRDTSQTYADRWSGSDEAVPEVVDVYLRIEHPLRLDLGGRRLRGTAKMLAQAYQGGHDGVIIKNAVDGYNGEGIATTIYAVFDAKQIKSVLNNGSFDRDDPRIQEDSERIDELYGIKTNPNIDMFKKALAGNANTRLDRLDAFAKLLKTKGYKPLGSGYFGVAFTHPNLDYVIKIFGLDPSYRKYVGWCQQNRENPHLPKFVGGIIRIDDDHFMIRTELLQPPSTSDQSLLTYMVSVIAKEIRKQGDVETAMAEIFDEYQYNEGVWKLFEQQPDLIETLKLIASTFGADKLDLPRSNMMFRGETLVFTDPLWS